MFLKHCGETPQTLRECRDVFQRTLQETFCRWVTSGTVTRATIKLNISLRGGRGSDPPKWVYTEAKQIARALNIWDNQELAWEI